MRPGLLAAALLLTAAPATAADSLPPIVFQVQPIGQVLDQVRGAADVVGGQEGVKAVNNTLKELFGEKGLDGFDLNRPIVGYVVLSARPENITLVLALPVTGEKEFIALCDRVNVPKVKADEKDKTLYHLPPLDTRYQAMMRFADGYAYIAYGMNPAPQVEAKALVPMPKLYDGGERGLAAARLHFDRIPLAVKLAAPLLFGEVKKTISEGLGFGFGRQETELFKPVMEQIEKLGVRYALLSAGADVFTARVLFDQQAGNFVAEATLTVKPNSELAKMVAAYKPAPNKFAALADHPDTVAAVCSRAPLFAPEMRNGFAAGFEGLGKLAIGDAPPAGKAAVEELFKGLARTAKNTELDFGVALRGPDKDGWFHVIGAVAFDDPAALEKEFKALLQKTLPKEELDRIKWDAAKAGNVSIHTYHWETGGFFDFTKFLGGENCYAGFAFAPDGLVGVVGPDPISVVKDVLAAKPAPAKGMAVFVNPGRVVKVLEKVAPNERKTLEMANLLGREDKLLPAGSVEVVGGNELRVTATVNLRLLPRLMFEDAIKSANREPAKDAPPFGKK